MFIDGYLVVSNRCGNRDTHVSAIVELYIEMDTMLPSSIWMQQMLISILLEKVFLNTTIFHEKLSNEWIHRKEVPK